MPLQILRSITSAFFVFGEGFVLHRFGMLTLHQTAIFWIAGIASVIGVLAIGIASYFNGMLTVAQMRKRFGDNARGMPNFPHGGMWGDDFFLSPVIGLAIALYGDTWSWWQVVPFGVLSIIVNEIRTIGDARNLEHPDSLAWKGDGVTMAGWIHMWYSNVAMTVMFLFAFCDRPSGGILLLASAFLAGLMVSGAGCAHWTFNKIRPQTWMPEINPAPLLTLSLGSLILIVLLNWLGFWEYLGDIIASYFH